MELLWQELTFGIPDGPQAARIFVRMLASVLFGAAIGYERERAGKAAGLRTHILVTLGTCVFVITTAGFGMSSDGLSRVIQGIITGIGFIGAGAILKLDDEVDIRGLTSAAGIYMACAVGVAVGLGEIGIGLIATILTLVILTLSSFERKAKNQKSG